MYSSNSITGHLSSWLVAHILGLNFPSFAEIFLDRSTDHSTYFPALDLEITKLQLVVLLATTETKVLANIPARNWHWRVLRRRVFRGLFLEHLLNHLSGQRLNRIWLITLPRLLQELDFCVYGFISVGEIFVTNDVESCIFSCKYRSRPR